MSSKIAVVTGSNKGIGYEIVRGLCSKFDGDVLLTARDEERGKKAVQKLEKDGWNSKFHLLDISSVDSIKTLASFLKTNYGGIDILVNNASIAYKQVDAMPFDIQAENTIHINFFGTLNVCKELFPLLKPHARVVNVSSLVGKLSFIPGLEIRERFSSPTLTEDELCSLISEFVKDAKDGVHEKKGWGKSAYAISKLGINALTVIQNRKFLEDPGSDIVINSVHPGYVVTDMTSHRGVLTPEQGADAPLYCALLPPNIKSPRGEFIWNDKTIASWMDC